MRLFFTYLLVTIAIYCQSQTIQVSLYNSKKVSTYTLSVRQGKYLLVCDGDKLAEYKKSSIFYVNKLGNKIEIRDKQSRIGLFSEVKFLSSDENGVVSLRALGVNEKSREYNDALIFALSEDKLSAINHVDLEKYIAAVIEAEGGISAPLEYYKAQGVLVRTYTIKSIYKHAEEGFNLCDEVHCQAYHGRCSRNPEIYKATRATTGEALIDKDSILAMTPFHSSCGGQTSSSGVYWQTDLPYLQSVYDPFCVEQKNANWEELVPLSEWRVFLVSKGVVEPEKHYYYSYNGREKYFSSLHNITLRNIRQQFNLRSTFFSISPKEENILIKGRGYGHGIGMCQIGAMEMAKVGFSYIDILHFYFQNVLITDYREMELNRY